MQFDGTISLGNVISNVISVGTVVAGAFYTIATLRAKIEGFEVSLRQIIAEMHEHEREDDNRFERLAAQILSLVRDIGISEGRSRTHDAR